MPTGTMALVHSHCLETWISTSCRRKCELCNTEYNGKIKLKYNILTSIPRYVWAKKGECGMVYCHVKMWLYMYILYSLMIEYMTNLKGVTSSPFLTIFLVFAFCAALFLFLYSFVTCVQSWNRWRRCQYRFVLEKNDGLQQV